MILSLFLCAFASPQETASEPRPGVAALKDAERIFALGNPEQARVLVERSIAEMFAARPDALDVEDDRALRDAGALAYKLRSMEPARRAWDAVRRFREKTLDPTSMELQNARGNVSWIGEQMGLIAEARVLEEQILAVLEKTLPADHDALQTARGNLADTLLQQGEFERALELFTQVATVRRAKLAVEHPQRLRSELDLACGHVAVDALEEADRIVSAVLVQAPAELTAVRVRAATDLVLIHAARGERELYAAAFTMLAQEIEAAQAQVKKLAWREAEIRTAELAPFLDLLMSAALGLGVFPADDAWIALAARRFAVGRAWDQEPVVFHRFERSRIEGKGRDRRVLADERLTAAVFPFVPPDRTEHTFETRTAGARWIDLGPMGAIHDLVRALDTALRKGEATTEADSVSRAIYAPVSKALGDPQQLIFVPDDVLWAVPMDVVELRHGGTRVTALVPVLNVMLRHVAVAWSLEYAVLGDPKPISERARSAGAVAASAGGAARAYIPLGVASTKELTDAFGRAAGVEPLRGDDVNPAQFRALPVSFGDIVITTPVWSSPDDVPCLTTPRPIVGSSPLSAAMAREDVVGGTSPADLCGFIFSDFGAEPGPNQRVVAAPRASDLRELSTGLGSSLLVAVPPPRADVLVRARDIEALARSLFTAGFLRVGFATQPLRDVRENSLLYGPASEMDELGPGPWLRVRGVP